MFATNFFWKYNKKMRKTFKGSKLTKYPGTRCKRNSQQTPKPLKNPVFFVSDKISLF